MTEDEPGDEKIDKHQLDFGRYLLDCPFIRAYLDALVSSKTNQSQKAKAISLEESRITVKLARMDFVCMDYSTGGVMYISFHISQPSKLLVLGMVIPPSIGNPNNRYVNPYYFVAIYVCIAKLSQLRETPAIEATRPPWLSQRRVQKRPCRLANAKKTGEKQMDGTERRSTMRVF